VGGVEVQGVGVARSGMASAESAGVDVTNSRSALALASIHPILSSTHALQIQKGKHVVLWLLYPLVLLGSSSHAMCFLYASALPNIQYLCQWHSNAEFTSR
jgi:hypothetical protein